jgi:hypothetical protein
MAYRRTARATLTAPVGAAAASYGLTWQLLRSSTCIPLPLINGIILVTFLLNGKQKNQSESRPAKLGGQFLPRRAVGQLLFPLLLKVVIYSENLCRGAGTGGEVYTHELSHNGEAWTLGAIRGNRLTHVADVTK